MANAWARDRAGLFYFGFGVLGLAAVFVGFSTTYFLPMARRSLAAPPVVHLHGAMCLTWVLLFISQCLLVRTRRTRFHRQLGMAGIPVALAVLATGLGTALWATERDLGTVPTALATMIGTLTSLTIFVAFVIFAVAKRRQPDWHKRLMMLATIVVLWPAYFRFRHLLPWLPRPEIWLALVLADLPILVGAVRDRLVYGRVHPVWAIFGSALVVEQTAEVMLFETVLWRNLGGMVHGLMS
jgi:uncharacterized membrane protein